MAVSVDDSGMSAPEKGDDDEQNEQRDDERHALGIGEWSVVGTLTDQVPNASARSVGE